MEIEIDNMQIDIWPLGIIILLVILIVLWRQKRSSSYLFCFSVFGVYLLFALKEAFFPIQINGAYVDAMKQVPFMSNVNLIPLYFGPFPDVRRILPGIYLNILLTMPFGYGLRFITKFKVRNFPWIAMGIGLGIETAQLIISLILRYPYRVIDINDVLFNLFGAVLGYGFFIVFSWVYLAMTRRLYIEHGGLSAYIHDIALQAQTTDRLNN
jgi:glycopeptide antibiotics resistance protein